MATGESQTRPQRVRNIRTVLDAKAKEERGCRFHTLFDKPPRTGVASSTSSCRSRLRSRCSVAGAFQTLREVSSDSISAQLLFCEHCLVPRLAPLVAFPNGLSSSRKRSFQSAFSGSASARSTGFTKTVAPLDQRGFVVHPPDTQGALGFHLEEAGPHLLPTPDPSQRIDSSASIVTGLLSGRPSKHEAAPDEAVEAEQNQHGAEVAGVHALPVHQEATHSE